MREPRYSLLTDIQYDIELARQGKFALYGQRNIAREYRCKKATPEEQQAYETLQNVLFMVPQWSDTEELHSDMERIGGRVWFCYFWNDHDSMIQLTEDSCGTFTTAYVLDADITPEMHKSAARQAQQQLAVCMQEWSIPLMKSFVPEKEKYEYLEEAASHLMQVLNAVIGIRKIDKTFHGTGKPLCRKSRSWFFTAHNKNLAMPIKVVWQ